MNEHGNRHKFGSRVISGISAVAFRSDDKMKGKQSQREILDETDGKGVQAINE